MDTSDRFDMGEEIMTKSLAVERLTMNRESHREQRFNKVPQRDVFDVFSLSSLGLVYLGNNLGQDEVC